MASFRVRRFNSQRSVISTPIHEARAAAYNNYVNKLDKWEIFDNE